MLELLDSINWSGLVHIYGQNEKIPEKVRQLLSTDSEQREDALDFLFGGGQDYGNIYDTTAYLIPFALEIIADANSLARIDLLDRLNTTTLAKVYTGGRRDYSIRQLRNYLNAYDAIERGLPLYLKLLNESNIELRTAAISVLGALSASAASILPILRDHFANETAEKVQVSLLEAMMRLLQEQDFTRVELRKEYAPFFRQIIDGASTPRLRIAAAQAAVNASVSMGFGTRLKTEESPPNLVAALVEHYWAVADDYYPYYARIRIVKQLALLPDATPLVEILQHPNTTPDDAQTLVKGLMSRHIPFKRENMFWEPLRRNGYEIYPKSDFLNFDKTRTTGIWETLRVIIDADKYWDTPTNLLSVTFDLPDDREKLRAFVEDTDYHMDVDAYLERINYHGSRTPNIETLRALHLAHLIAVPFENLNIGLGRPIILDMTLLYDKIVRQRRGGFCYELNGLFGELLKALGYHVEMISSGVYEGDKFGPDFDHMMLVVTLDERWLLDVGFGDAFREPLLLDAQEEQVQGDRRYRIEREREFRILGRQLPGMEWEKLYRYTEQPHLLSEYVPMCNYQQTAPESHFVLHRICTRATPEGQITLSERHLIVTENGKRQETLINSEDEYTAALRDHFGITLNLA